MTATSADLAQPLKRLGQRIGWHRQAFTQRDVGGPMVET
jgi:hypothetical protein